MTNITRNYFDKIISTNASLKFYTLPFEYVLCNVLYSQTYLNHFMNLINKDKYLCISYNLFISGDSLIRVNGINHECLSTTLLAFASSLKHVAAAASPVYFQDQNNLSLADYYHRGLLTR